MFTTITHVPHQPRAGPRREQEEGPPAMASPSSTEPSFPPARDVPTNTTLLIAEMASRAPTQLFHGGSGS